MENPWSRLPDEIIAKIQARLPLKSLLRSRAVCRAWKAAVDSPAFSQERLESGVEARDCMLVVAGLCQSESSNALSCCAYDPASDRWHQLKLPVWLGRIEPDPIFISEEGESTSTGERASAWTDGGMLLGELQPAGVQPTVFAYIRNPTNHSKPAYGQICNVRGLFVDTVAKCFKLVMVSDVHPGVRTMVFDSAVGSWCVTTSSFPPLDRSQFSSERVPHFLAGQGVFVGTVLYCFVAKGNLLAYDLERASWSWLAVAKPTVCDTLYSNLIKVRDRLLCAAVVCNGRQSCLQIWEMNFERMAWTEVNTMPAPMFTYFGGQGLSRTPFNYRFKPTLQAVAGQDEVYIMHEKVDKIAVLHLAHAPAAWRWLPSLPYEDFVNKSYYGLHPVAPWLEYGFLRLFVRKKKE